MSVSVLLALLSACTGTPKIEAPEFLIEYCDEVIEMIDAIPEATFETEADIIKAYNEYLNLTDDEKALITNYDKLKTFNDELAALYNTEKRMGDRINRNQILIGTYCFNFNDEAHVKELADAGFNFITATGYDQAKLDNLAKYGIGAFVSGLPSWRGDDRLPEDVQPEPTLSMDTYREAVQNLADHEAIWGIDIIDEPNALDFPFLNQQVTVINEEREDYLPYINLHPLHGRARLGTTKEIRLADGYSADYSEYIGSYVRDIDLDFICYDHYFYQNGSAAENELIGALYLQKCVSQACVENNKDFWIVIQLNSRNDQSRPAVPLSTEQLQMQSFLALTFGARTINWACWNPGWWTYNVYDADGNRTAQYEKVTEVNKMLHELSPVYIKYKYVDTCSVSRPDRDIGDMITHFDNEIEQSTFKNLTADNRSFVMAGYFEKTVGSKGSAMMFLNLSDKMCQDPYTNIATISFETDREDAIVTAYIMGHPQILEPVNGTYTFHLNNAEYAFVTIE